MAHSIARLGGEGDGAVAHVTGATHPHAAVPCPQCTVHRPASAVCANQLGLSYVAEVRPHCSFPSRFQKRKVHRLHMVSRKRLSDARIEQDRQLDFSLLYVAPAQGAQLVVHKAGMDGHLTHARRELLQHGNKVLYTCVSDICL